MLTFTITLDSLAFYIVVADIVILLVYVLYIQHKKRKLARAINAITDFIAVYFRNTGSEVRVTCVKLAESKRFVALIESQPLKRFRYSNIIENNLINHIFKITGHTVEKIYWRFPVQLTQEVVLSSDKGELEEEDLYFLKQNPAGQSQTEYKVSEVSWEHYENPEQEK